MTAPHDLTRNQTLVLDTLSHADGPLSAYTILDRLRDAGVQTTVTRYPGMYHGFLMFSGSTARGRLAIAEIGALLRAKFATPLHF